MNKPYPKPDKSDWAYSEQNCSPEAMPRNSLHRARFVYKPEMLLFGIQQELRANAMESLVSMLQKKIEQLELKIESDKSELDPRIEDVVRITAEMFGSDPIVEVDSDPEEPEFPFVVFNVKYSGNSQEVLDMRKKWHRKVRNLQPGSSSIRLSVTPK